MCFLNVLQTKCEAFFHHRLYDSTKNTMFHTKTVNCPFVKILVRPFARINKLGCSRTKSGAALKSWQDCAAEGGSHLINITGPTAWRWVVRCVALVSECRDTRLAAAALTQHSSTWSWASTSGTWEVCSDTWEATPPGFSSKLNGKTLHFHHSVRFWCERSLKSYSRRAVCKQLHHATLSWLTSKCSFILNVKTHAQKCPNHSPKIHQNIKVN